MAEQNVSNIKLSEPNLRVGLEFYCKSIARQINTTNDPEIKEIYERKLRTFQHALMTINQMELIPQGNRK